MGKDLIVNYSYIPFSMNYTHALTYPETDTAHTCKLHSDF